MPSNTFPNNFSWLFQNGPSIPIINAKDNIEILTSPTDFHQKLINLSSTAKNRISLSTLYLGNDPYTKKLIDSIHNNLKSNKNEKFNFSIICDYARGNRNSDSTRGAILPMKQEFPDKVKLSMYATPAVGNTMKKYLPTTLREAIGVQHTKIYLFDDDVVISGANLRGIFQSKKKFQKLIISVNLALKANYP